MSTDLDCLNLSMTAYLGDTMHFSLPQHGAYLLILMAMRRARGWIKDDDVVLANICKLSLTKWKKIAPGIREKMISEDGKLSQKRLLSDVISDLKTVEKNRQNGSAGGKAKALKNKDADLATAKLSPASRQKLVSTATSFLEPDSVKKEGSKKDSRGTRLPSDWMPTAELREYGRSLKLTDQQIDAMASEMKIWAGANANRQIARKADWSLTFKGWMRRGSEKLNSRGGSYNGTTRKGGSAGFASNLAAFVSGANQGRTSDFGQGEVTGVLREIT